MKFFLDTNIIIYYLKGLHPSIEKHFRKIPSQSIVIPSIVLSEIEYGARKSFDYTKTINLYNSFTENFNSMPFSENHKIEYGKIRAELEKEGKTIGPNDLIIASMVISEDGVLITHNTGEFSHIHKLRTEDWTLV